MMCLLSHRHAMVQTQGKLGFPQACYQNKRGTRYTWHSSGATDLEKLAKQGTFGAWTGQRQKPEP